MNNEQDLHWMSLALNLSEKARVHAPPNPWVGCVIVKNNQLIGQGHTQPPGSNHAEICALQEAGTEAYGATLYVTLEPCSHHGRTPPCVDAILKASLKRVVIGIKDPDKHVSGKGIEILKMHGIEVTVGVLNEVISKSLAPYLHHRLTNSAYCVCKAAVSIDGRTAAADGSSQWISCPEAREDAHLLRAQSQAILIGSGTAMIDSPRLTVRLPALNLKKQPLRVILDSHGTLPPTGPLFDVSLAHTWILTTENTPEDKQKRWKAAGVEVFLLPGTVLGSGVDLKSVLQFLGAKGILQVLVEGGGTLIGNLLDESLIDLLYLYIGPLALGAKAKPLFGKWDAGTLSNAPKWKLEEYKTFGQTMRVTYGRNM